ncbi:thyroglobulin isoform X1 [Tympanuchus pallidicinctus]|uniref:thyroglobulin isoform X1 n=1 Tax=Tympanuchus pallidicinctus TaxID=109042 RepID=UPI0022874AC0|nr:thyroglobulin isoform X1 [Tympanuchus pallidicinctus]
MELSYCMMGSIPACTLLCFISIAAANIFEYQTDSQPLRPCELQREKAFTGGETYIPQCSENGQFRAVQCSRNGLSCWCVDENGIEVPGSKQNGYPLSCLSFCQLQKQRVLVSAYINSSSISYIPQCLDSGAFDVVQCDVELRQCWCVDQEGMEIYGTRQRGKPTQCPGACEIRDRRILHGVGEKSPPQCSEDGEFLPVQCKFVNTTDMMVFDLIHNYNRLPAAFQTFSSFRETFPEISGYCYCVDSLGRELADTGLELLLDEVYDTIFSALEPARTFTETSTYRILQRRFLGVQLATSGRFRCPSKCEVERYAAQRYQHAYIPSCDSDGGYTAMQCQQGGQCWCVDTKGQEVQGTKRRGQPPACGEEQTCISERQRALSRIFYGPAGYFSQSDLFSTPDVQSEKRAGFSRPCPPSFKELFLDSGLSSPIVQSPYASQIPGLESILSEAISGMFPSRELAQVALQFTANPKRFQENLFGGKFLKNMIQFNFTGALGTSGKYSIGQFFTQEDATERNSSQGLLQSAVAFPLEISKESSILSQALVDSFGRTVTLQDNQNMIKFLSSVLELPEFFTFLQQVISVPRSIAEDLGEVVKLALGSKDCGEETRDLFVPTCTKEGRYEEVQCYAGECWCLDTSGKEVPGSRVQGERPRCPSDCEKQRRNLQNLKQSLSAGSDLFIPSCTKNGDFLPLQCYGTNCFCVDLNGKTIPGIRGNIGKSIKCPSACQITAGQEFLKTLKLLLSDPSSLTQLSSIYLPQCDTDGAWRQVQCNGPPEQAFEWYERWITENNEGKTLPIANLLNILIGYKNASSKGYSGFIEALYETGHQNVFPAFTSYSSFADLPPEVLEGNLISASENILLDPYTFWQLLNEEFTYYPGAYADFSAPLSHFELRDCWCVNSNGEELQGTRAEVNQVPTCPGICQSIQQEAVKFIEETEQLIQASNTSHFPFGESFLMAKGMQLMDSDLLRSTRPYESEMMISEKLLSGSDYALQLAAQSVLHFYWQNHFTLKGFAGEATQLGFHPYIPQCDGLGNWEPTQCYESTGHCWCVDERGRYVMDSLVSRSAERPKCQTSCQRSRANALISNWRQSGSKLDASATDLFVPYCLETGEYTVLQRSYANTWCVDPESGEVFQPGNKDSDGNPECPSFCNMLELRTSLREAGKGYIPKCEEPSGIFSPVQCTQDEESCWCVFDNGEEVPGTRVSGGRPACESPQCAMPFGTSSILNGAVFCANDSGQMLGVQQCWLACRQGYKSAASNTLFQCDVQKHLWISAAPLYHACQKLQLFQTVQAQTHFQLLLPPQKTCSSDYSGLLQAFQIFILDELKARGFCHLQVNAFGNTGSVSVCDDSSVYVECLSVDRLGVNVTWRALLENIPAASLPDLHNIENALVGEKLIGAFIKEIEDGRFLLYLDSKQFPADSFIDFPQDEEFDLSPRVQLGCRRGFRRISSPEKIVPNAQGCVVCPPGTNFQNGECIPCPLGYYQHQTGRLSCIKCPVGKTTNSYGAFSADDCITYCQGNEQGLQCNEDGQYRPSQQDPDTNKSFCVDDFGVALDWTETDDLLTDYECSVLRKFERVPASTFVYGSDKVQILQSQSFGRDLQSLTFQCISDCDKEEACSFAAVTPADAEILCDLYSAAEVNFNCTTSGLVQGALGNPATTSIGRLSCLLYIRNPEGDAVMVYLKKAQEFNSSGLKTFERTSFQNVLSGVYRSMALSAASTSLTDAQLFCRQTCSRDSCCDGFIFSQIALDGGTILCSLMTSPDVLICNANGWSPTQTSVINEICRGLSYDEGEKIFSFTLGGQVFSAMSKLSEEAERNFTTFQQVFLWRGSDMAARPESSECDSTALKTEDNIMLSDSTKDLFYLMDDSQIRSDPNSSILYQQYWVFRQKYSAEEAMLWCLTRCAQEDEFCQMADLQNTADTYFVCTLYPEAQICDGNIEQMLENCRTELPWQPQALYHKIVTLRSTVKSFYRRVPFQKATGISVRNVTDMSRKAVSNGFFECERWCDADPCCTGFGFLNVNQLSGGKIMCLTLNSLGIQTCAEESRSAWQISNCSLPDTEVRIHPFGWYQKPADLMNTVPNLCPTVSLPFRPESEYLDTWQPLNVSSVLVDSTVSNFEAVHVSREISNGFATAKDYCLSACSRNQTCAVVTLEIQASAIRCLFYPDTQICSHGLEGHSCQVLLKEPATYIYRRQDLVLPISESDLAPSVYIPSHGDLIGKPQAVRIGTEWKNISQFLGIPYAAPPLAERRFNPPEPFAWEKTWNATVARSTCWQPGDRETSSYSVSEDCLYMNVFVPVTAVKNLSVLLFFHNGGSGNAEAGKTIIDGSYLAAISNTIVVTANYRVGVFGFLSVGSSEASGNAGLLDQLAALKWVQQNIGSFGGDPSQVTVGADRGGADIASIHLLTEAINMGLFRRVLLMGGSAFSPASIITKRRAQAQAAVLADDVGCPSSTSEEIVACLRQLPAHVLNNAQTKLLAISGPFQYWGPVVDEVYLQEPLAKALQRPQLQKVDLLIGSAQQDGLISRAKAIKKFEESQGRTNSKTAFYQALQNSLGGEDSNLFIEDAAIWYYSLEHSADDYSSFSRALENATRDQFITCPIISMANHWAANSRGNVFMYYVPASSESSSGLELLLDVQYAFGLPFYPKYEDQFTLEEKSLSLQIMQYISNFVNSGNPNYPHSFSRKMSRLLPLWPMFLPNDDGDNYKEFTISMPTLKGLKKADCSFWSDYIRRLKASTVQLVSLRSQRISQGRRMCPAMSNLIISKGILHRFQWLPKGTNSNK